jgi:hypothetical protein
MQILLGSFILTTTDWVCGLDAVTVSVYNVCYVVVKLYSYCQ